MKKAFTLLELVFVVVIIGILSTFISPTFGSDPLNQAANQIVSHIRYTQHLAMMDNKFNAQDQFWYTKRWQIQFQTDKPEKFYAIYANRDGNGTNPQRSDVAVDPLNRNRLLTGQKTIATTTIQYNKKMHLSSEYDITSVTFSNSCTEPADTESQRISFDALGRPLYGNAVSLTRMYSDGTGSRLIATQCRITLTDNDGKTKIIAIEPETGYTHIL